MREIEHLAALMENEPLGVQIGLVEDVMPNVTFQLFYAGDDVTDEDAFEALGADDLGLKSGDGPTLANFRVQGPTQVARAIALLADLREGDVHEQ